MVQPLPRELLAGIELALRRYVGMRQHAVGPDPMALHDVAAQRNDSGDLRLRKIRISVTVARIGDLDADAARIDVAHTFPRRLTCMPGALRLRHKLENVAVLLHDVMR